MFITCKLYMQIHSFIRSFRLLSETAMPFHKPQENWAPWIVLPIN